MLKRLFERYGAPVTLIMEESEWEYKAFIQPMRYKNKMFVDNELTKIGTMDESCFLYIGPPEYKLREGEFGCFITLDDNIFNVVRTETVRLGDSEAYTWAVLREFV